MSKKNREEDFEEMESYVTEEEFSAIQDLLYQNAPVEVTYQNPVRVLIPDEKEREAARKSFWETKWILEEKDRVEEKDILGLFSVKKVIRETIELAKNWKEYNEANGNDIDLPRGALLCGNPGNGKTMCLRWIITSLDGECFNARKFPVAQELLTKHDIAAMYEGAEERSRITGKPVFIIWDEMDAYIRKDKGIEGKDGVQSELCTQMDGISSNNSPIFLIGTANYTEGFEPALTRPGRISQIAECVPLSVEDSKTYLISLLDKKGLPHPPEEHILDLLADGDRSAAEIKEAVGLAQMRAIVSHGKLTKKTIGHALLEQFADIPSDIAYDKEFLIGISYHEVGHALAAHALGLRIQRIDVHRVANRHGSLILSERAIETQIDGFCYVIAAMGGKMMEVHRLGASHSSLFSAVEDYRAIVQNFTVSLVQSGGRNGSSFDWQSLAERMDFIADTRAEKIDREAQKVMETSVSLNKSMYLALEEGAKIKLVEALRPFVERLAVEGIILGSDAFAEIESLVHRPFGWFRDKALEEWEKIEVT